MARLSFATRYRALAKLDANATQQKFGAPWLHDLATPASDASWADREGVNVQLGQKNDDFVRNLLTMLCECRRATLVRNPQHLAYGPVTA